LSKNKNLKTSNLQVVLLSVVLRELKRIIFGWRRRGEGEVFLSKEKRTTMIENLRLYLFPYALERITYATVFPIAIPFPPTLTFPSYFPHSPLPSPSLSAYARQLKSSLLPFPLPFFLLSRSFQY
jgi:hypothetical protein